MTTRFLRLGLQDTWLTNYLKAVDVGVKWFGNMWTTLARPQRNRRRCHRDAGRQEDLLTYFDFVQLTHLECIHGFGDPREHVHLASALAVDYFHGAWRDNTIIEYQKCDRDKCRQLAHWFDEFRIGLMRALLARQSEDALRLAQFVNTDLPDEEGVWFRSKDDNRVYMTLAAYIRDGSLAGCENTASAVRISRKRRPRLILDCLEALGDEKCGGSLQRTTEAVEIVS